LPNTAGPDLISGYDPNGPRGLAGAIIATRVATFFTQPLFVGAPPGDTGRLFVVEKTGAIKIIDLASGQVLPTPFLDVSSQVLTDGERGLLGLAFDPDFATNGFFYVNLSSTNGNTEIRRYHVSSNPNVADTTSATTILSIDQSEFNNHKGGWLGFGPDGDLYISVGDGGGSGDTLHSGQNIDSLRGKILRIDVHSPSDPGLNYHIPADNPFVGQPGARGEIFALGLRNPWRPSFDRATGDLYIADVGQNTWEEIDIGQKGANYGWNHFEGPALFPGGDAISTGPVVAPIYSYNHNGTSASITGGYVYRGDGAALQGQYFFADFVQGKVFTLAFNGSAWVATDRTSQIVTDVGALTLPSSFGEDGRGNLYIVDFGGGNIFRLTPTVFSAPPPAGTTADMILRRGADGLYEIYDIGNNSVLAAYQLGQVGTEWTVAGLGSFSGNDTTDMILRDRNNGAFEVYDISNNKITGAGTLGQVGLEYQVAGFGNFNGPGAGTDMMMRNSNTGAFELYDINNNSITGASQIGQVGLEWKVAGFGDFNGDGTTDMLLRDTLNGVFEVYDIKNSQLVGASTLGQVGNEYQVAGFGDFNGDGTTDMMLRNVNTGTFELYDIKNNMVAGASAIGQVGLEWQVAGFGPFNGAGTSDMVLRNTNTGAFEVYDIANNQITGASNLGTVALDWQVGGFAVDPPTTSVGSSSQVAQLVQAMAGFGGGSGAAESLNPVALGADTSQQSLLTTPQHA
jgi:glucose/arabinose dehydrogenase